MIDVDALANEIRRVDGNHDKGAGALAEALMPFLTAALAPQVKVKPLEWEELSERCWDADGMGKLYRVMKRIDGSAKLKHGVYDHGVDYADLDAAKSAAQADYTSRIMSALNAPQVKETPPPSTQVMGKAEAFDTPEYRALSPEKQVDSIQLSKGSTQ